MPVTPRARIAIATSTRGRQLDQDLETTVQSLVKRGVDASAVDWDDTSIDWSGFDLVVVRSTWGYPDRRADYLGWARSIERIENPADVLEWNTDKHYLADLASAGVPTVPTVWIEPGARAPFVFPNGELVVKPTVGAGGAGAARFGPDEHELADQHVTALLGHGHPAMVQPYLDAIDSVGERGLVFIDGRFSHAIFKPPLLAHRGPFDPAGFTVGVIAPSQASPTDLDFATSVLAAMPLGGKDLLYARVDIVAIDGGHRLLIELEVTEPNLYFNYAPGSSDRFADAVLERLLSA